MASDDDHIRPGEPPLAGTPRRDVDAASPFIGSIELPYDVQHADRAFRGQTLALGAAWICVGLCCGVIAWYLWSMDGPARHTTEVQWLIPSFAFSTLLWGGLGVMTCLRRMGAVYAGLAVNYLVMIGYVAYVLIACGLMDGGARLFGAILAPLCPTLAIVLSILQAHRVIRFEKRLQEARLR